MVTGRNPDASVSSQFGPQRLQVFVERFMDLGKKADMRHFLRWNNEQHTLDMFSFTTSVKLHDYILKSVVDKGSL